MERILFLNQVTGPLFRELVSDVASQLGPCALLTGTPADPARALGGNVRLILAPAYDRRSTWRRAASWLAFFVVALRHVLFGPRRTMLFLVSNPPFLGLAGWLGAVVRGRKYAVLVYDLYPGLLVGLGRLPPTGIIARSWHRFNRLVWGRATYVFTIGEYMAANIRPHLPERVGPELRVVPNWADSTVIRPVAKADNPFARRLGLVDKTTILYSGNLGNSHDLGPLLAAAAVLRDRSDLVFLIIGGGVRFQEIEKRIEVEQLCNVTLLPLQPETDLPWTMACGDVAVVTFERGAEGYMVPSKTYYYMAAGCALLVIAAGENEVTRLVRSHACGLVVAPDDTPGMVAALERFRNDRGFLTECRRKARAVQESDFGRANAGSYAEPLRVAFVNEEGRS
jgi:glycosyltransferase involved in cell wall biosynthesis